MNKKKSRSILLIVFFILLPCIGHLQSNELFLMKSYGEILPYPGYPKTETPSKYEKLLIDKQGLISENSMLYMRKPKIGIASSFKISVRISEYEENRHAKNALLIMIKSRRVEFNIEDNIIKMNRAYYWSSGSNNISLMPSFMEVPQEMLSNYLLLHPPTANIKPSDFNAQKIIKTLIKRSHEIIKDADKMRILPARLTPGLPRAEAYIGMIAQCSAEASIRCWAGMYEENHVDCPISFIQNDFKRNKKWKEFKEESISKPIVEENVNWASVGSVGVPKCRFRHEDTKEGTHPSDLRSIVRNELNMSHSELKSLSLTGEKVPSAFIHR